MPKSQQRKQICHRAPDSPYLQDQSDGQYGSVFNRYANPSGGLWMLCQTLRYSCHFFLRKSIFFLQTSLFSFSVPGLPWIHGFPLRGSGKRPRLALDYATVFLLRPQSLLVKTRRFKSSILYVINHILRWDALIINWTKVSFVQNPGASWFVTRTCLRILPFFIFTSLHSLITVFSKMPKNNNYNKKRNSFSWMTSINSKKQETFSAGWRPSGWRRTARRLLPLRSRSSFGWAKLTTQHQRHALTHSHLHSGSCHALRKPRKGWPYAWSPSGTVAPSVAPLWRMFTISSSQRLGRSLVYAHTYAVTSLGICHALPCHTHSKCAPAHIHTRH